MSATFENDISLLYNLDFSLESVLNPIEPKNRNDFGQRLILTPKRYFNDFDDDSLKNIINHHIENEQNILVIIPNYKDAELWEHHGAKKITHNIEEELENFKKSKGNFIVITNRYDGIDLSGNICNVLILHNHPNHKFLTDKYSETMLYTKHSNIIAQTIEQGMGRTVRSGNDFSVVYLLGRNILKFLRQRENFKYLNKHTRKQIEIGIDLLNSDEEIEKENIPKIICETANSCLEQDQDWLDFYQTQMDSINESEDDENKENRYKIKNIEKLAMIEFLEDDYEKASSIIEEILKEDISDNEKTTYYLLLANITFFIEKNTSNDLLVKARKISHLSFQPFLSKDYLKSSINSKEQIIGALEYLNSFTTLNDAINSIRETINNLQYSPHNKADKFEEAVKELGLVLGYSSTRPEKDKKEGPDNLWIMDNNCK
ncbi:helicase C-terminal domain-containing protein [Chryseobacterium sp. SG20098]|uniref:helicase C-terminal domain-containing protein n=1 Tax=Chryseobacterium sp. SG20098 TaxID=3074145 RepID=UPI002882FD46|nr:helicase C-terminal domain-containing protein [Chryseobacterium sp. SG20098]WNI37069.1 hypothetical protein RHP76_01095 [Chryseobacterium sp. SG20098]